MRCNNQVIILAGPSCVGKTTLLQTLEDSDLSWFRNAVRLGTRSSWESLNAWEWPTLQTRPAGKNTLLVHYDIFRILSLGVCDYEADPALGLLCWAKDITFVTLWETPDELLRRSKKRQREIWKQLFRSRDVARFRSRISRRQQMRRFYCDSASLWTMYEKWFAYCALCHNSAHWLLRSSTPGSLSLMQATTPSIPVWQTHAMESKRWS